GDRAAVIMGGDPWASGGHIEAPPGADHFDVPPGAMTHIDGEAPFDLEVRSRGYFEFMEPVTVELRLKNRLENVSLPVDSRLDPDYGTVTVYIRRPDGRLLEYSPIACKLAALSKQTELILEANSAVTEAAGTNRFSAEVFLTYGRYGFYFDQPGNYLIRAVY